MKTTLTTLSLGVFALVGSSAFAIPGNANGLVMNNSNRNSVGISSGTATATAALDPYRPTGQLDLSKQYVRTGTKPNVTWNIKYPVVARDVVTINPDDSVIVKQRSLMEIRVVGAAFQSGTTELPVVLQSKVGTASWGTLFNGKGSQVIANSVLQSKIVEVGQRIDFSAQGSNGSGGWYSARNTLNAGNTLTALTNGNTIPYYTPAYNQGTITSFLSSYIKSNNGHGNNLDGVDSSNPGNAPFIDLSGTVDDEAKGGYRAVLGPREVIYLFELYATSTSNSKFDMQDLVVVVTFKDIP